MRVVGAGSPTVTERAAPKRPALGQELALLRRDAWDIA
jgi:hypothetical protein